MTPNFPIALINLQRGAQVVYGQLELVAVAKDVRDARQSWDGPVVVTQSLLVSLYGIINVAKRLRESCLELSVTWAAVGVLDGLILYLSAATSGNLPATKPVPVASVGVGQRRHVHSVDAPVEGVDAQLQQAMGAAASPL